jgi:pyruvate dehydrogenase E1 component
LVALGTDGFGLSESRANLRRHFEVDAPGIARAALHALREHGTLGRDAWEAASRIVDAEAKSTAS